MADIVERAREEIVLQQDDWDTGTLEWMDALINEIERLRADIDSIITNPRFVGLWTYRSHGQPREFCASVMVDGEVQETRMCGNWNSALQQAGQILGGHNQTAPTKSVDDSAGA